MNAQPPLYTGRIRFKALLDAKEILSFSIHSNFHIHTEMAYIWTTIKYLIAALLLSYAYWVYTETVWPYWTYTCNLPRKSTTSIVPGSPHFPPSTWEDSRAYGTCPDYERPSSRFAIGLRPGITVYGWPAKGGVYVLDDCVGVDLEFLGFDRLGESKDLSNETRSDSEEEEEEEHCYRSRYRKGPSPDLPIEHAPIL